MLLRLLIASLLLLLASPVLAQAEPKLNVIASFSIVGDMVNAVAGNAVDLHIMVGSNGDVHEYEPTPADAALLARADIIFINGLGLEGWIGRLIQSSGFKGKVVTLGDVITPIPADPHSWQSVKNAIFYVNAIKNSLVSADSKNASFYEANATRYSVQLDALDHWARLQINQVPQAQRQIISTHDAFQYFARDYGVTFIAPLGISTESQPSAADLAKIIDQVRKNKVKVVFLENMTDSRLIKQLEKDAGAFIGGTLYSDALSAKGGEAENYIAMFRHNVTVLVAAMLRG